MSTKYAGTVEEVAALDLYIKLSRAAESATQRINRHLHDDNLTLSQFGVLEALYFLGPLQPGQLAQKVLKSGGNMTLVIDNLAKRGLVTRQRRQDDRRCIDVEITGEGRALIASIFPGHVAGVVEAVSVLSVEEQQQLAALLRKLGLSVNREQ
ncbi:MAG: MarR family winged helix-turn-helix transcriptional regulator [Candidatus Promineifilaceae bacterium]